MAIHELNPCPFCGGEAEEKSQSTNFLNPRMAWYISCKACHATGPVTWHPKEAATKWNERMVNNECKT